MTTAPPPAAPTTATATDTKKDLSKKYIITPEDLFETDPLVASVDKKWGKLAAAASVEKAVKALSDKKYQVDVVDSKEAALKVLTALPLAESSVFLAGSTSLQEIGFTAFLRENPKATKRNIKAETVEAMGKGDWGAAGELMRVGQSADIVFSSVSAITESGEIVVCCASGSRTGSFASTAKKLVIVVGTNKIVSDLATAYKRQEEYCLPLEGGRSRIAFAAMGVKGSAINFQTTLFGGNPFGAPRVHVVVVKEHLGY